MIGERDNLKAGLFVLTGIVLALVVVFTFSNFERFFEDKQRVRVYYRLSDGLQGLKEGASVTLGDVPVGDVATISDHHEAETDRVIGEVVEVKIPKRYKIYQNAVVELVVPPLGSGTRLNIRSVGDTVPYDPEGEPITGRLAGSALTQSLMKDMGIEDEQRQQIKNIIANVESITATFRDDLPQISASVREAVADVRTLVADVRDRSAVWMDRLDSITESADASLARVDTLLEDKEPDLRRIVENVRDISQTAKDDTLERITGALKTANEALDNAKDITSEMKTFVISQRPVLERTIANMQLTAAQLKLAAIEVRRSPWRLLYKPTDQELESDNLYDAARSFALAAGTLDATAQSLQHVVERQPQDTEQIAQMLDYLDELFERFRVAEQAFWKAVGEHAPAP